MTTLRKLGIALVALLALPVVDDERKLAGVITADDIISVLRQK